jgi:hypothetical protein
LHRLVLPYTNISTTRQSLIINLLEKKKKKKDKRKCVLGSVCRKKSQEISSRSEKERKYSPSFKGEGKLAGITRQGGDDI